MSRCLAQQQKKDETGDSSSGATVKQGNEVECSARKLSVVNKHLL